MKKPLAIVAGAIVCFVLGFVIADGRGGTSANGDHPPINVPTAATQAWFPPIGDYDTGGEPMDDERFDALMTALDEALTARETLARFDREAPLHIWNFIRRFAIPWITLEQRKAVAAYLASFAEEYPDHAEVVESNMAALERYAGPSERVPAFSSKVSNYSYRPGQSDGEPFSDTQSTAFRLHSSSSSCPRPGRLEAESDTTLALREPAQRAPIRGAVRER